MMKKDKSTMSMAKKDLRATWVDLEEAALEVSQISLMTYLIFLAAQDPIDMNTQTEKTCQRRDLMPE